MSVTINSRTSGVVLEKPQDVIVDTTVSANTTAGTTEQILKQYSLPSGTLRNFNYFVLRILWTKSGTTDAATSCRIRIGTAGTTSDTQFVSATGFIGGSRAYATETYFFASSDTQLRFLARNATGGWGEATTSAAYPLNTTVSTMSGPLTLSLSMQMAGATDLGAVAHVILTGY